MIWIDGRAGSALPVTAVWLSPPALAIEYDPTEDESLLHPVETAASRKAKTEAGAEWRTGDLAS